jgi:outer membrane murein-binding lipoprotein Lpp
MMKKLLVLTVLVCSVAFAGCSKDGEIDSFISEFESVTKELTTKIEAGDIDGAKKAFDAKKSSLKSSWDSIKGARGFQVTEASQKKLMDSVTKNMQALGSATTSGIMKVGGDKTKVDQLKSLLDEYKDVFKM